ncbi:MAG: GNAT family N-acetyltransferase [Candidatus Hodarchaeota archaeon]
MRFVQPHSLQNLEVMVLIIRPFKIEDFRQVAKLWKAFMSDPSASDLHILPNDSNVKNWRKFVTETYAEDKNQVLVAEIEERIVGYIIFFVQTRTGLRTRYSWATIYDIYVHSDFRGRGIATKLIEKCLKYLESKNVTHVRLTVWVNNKIARKLYQRFSFEDYMIIVQRTL